MTSYHLQAEATETSSKQLLSNRKRMRGLVTAAALQLLGGWARRSSA